MIRFFKNLKFRHKVILLPSFAMVGFLLTLLITYSFSKSNEHLLSQVEAYHMPALELSQELENLLVSLQRELQDAVAMADQEELQNADALRDRFLRMIDDDNRARTMTPEERHHLRVRFLNYYALARKTSQRMIKGEVGEQMATAIGSLTHEYNEIRQEFESYGQGVRTHIRSFFDRTQKNNHKSLILMSVITLLSGTGLVGISVVVMLLITRSVTAVVNAADKISKGDFEERIGIDSQDELGVLAGSINHMASRISKSIEEKESALQQAIHAKERAQSFASALQAAYGESERLLSSISSILIGVNRQDKVTRWNKAAERIFGRPATGTVGKRFYDCDIEWDWQQLKGIIDSSLETGTTIFGKELEFKRPNDTSGFLSVTINPLVGGNGHDSGYLLLATDVTEQRALQVLLAQAHKLESIGQLAAGIAHEINTPIQYIGDNTRFLEDAVHKFDKILRKVDDVVAISKGGDLATDLVTDLETLQNELDLDYLLEESPLAIEQSLEGVERVASIVRAMKEFSHPGSNEKTLTDLNKAIENTITVARNEWKYVAEMVTSFDERLPLVPCLPGEINQVFLNIIVNAAHAIAGVVGERSGKKGTITVGTSHQDGWAEIRISDTGPGIPEEARAKIFDPFFTTKEVGKGSGQGLAISRNVVVEKHGGSIEFKTEVGKGTTFIIRLPLNCDSMSIQSDHPVQNEDQNVTIVK